jgi:hypothetical protein
LKVLIDHNHVCFRGFHNKNVNFNVLFDDNLGATHVFIKQIFRAAEQAPTHPTVLSEQGVG